MDAILNTINIKCHNLNFLPVSKKRIEIKIHNRLKVREVDTNKGIVLVIMEVSAKILSKVKVCL